MFNGLHAFGSGPKFCEWTQTFYNNVKFTVSVNGQLSERFLIQTGCRQGGPVSPSLFVTCVEALGIRIKEAKMSNSILAQGTENKVTQYADDKELMLEGDTTSFREAINTVSTLVNNLDCI